ncbi:MAG TPA: hypothetical protein DFS52_06245 [Myxococcales bacterium]|jgi:hypothetical protein|nr:hypothetical protein [Myxococcales bacterium]
MWPVLLLSGALLSMSSGVKPPEYSEKSLCDLWAGAQCELAKCGENAAERCLEESKRCRHRSYVVVQPDHAAKVSECAKALLKLKCGDAMPQECADVIGP